MKNSKTFLPALLSIALVFSLTLLASIVGASATPPQPDDHSPIRSVVDDAGFASAMALSTPAGNVTPMVAAGWGYTVGLKSDGTVVAVGSNVYGQCNVGGWTNIVQVAAGHHHTVGLKSDGTVVAVGENYFGECDVGSWTDIAQVAAALYHTVGLKSDGTLVAVGDCRPGQCDVYDWRNIVRVAAGYQHTVGLKSDGTVVAVGYNDDGQCDVGNWTDVIQVAAGYSYTVGLKSDGTVVAVGLNNYGRCDVGNWTDIVQVDAGSDSTWGLKSDGTVVATSSEGTWDVGAWTDIVQVAASGHALGLKSDGTVVAVGDRNYGQCDVGNWTGIIQVAARGSHTLGLKSDGTVVTVGDNYYGQCNVGNWTDIIEVAAGGSHTLGLRSDGTVVAVGWNNDGQCNVGNWTNIVQVAAGYSHTVGLKSDGTVVAAGDNDYGGCNVGNWTDIIQVSARQAHTVGLKSDGPVVAVGSNYYGQCNVGNWTDIVQVTAGDFYTVGLKSDGTVVAVGKNDDGQCNVGGWTGIIQVVAGEWHTVGLKSDGTVVAVGSNGYGQCNAGGWTGITQVAAGGAPLHSSHTVGLRSDGTVVAAGPGVELAKWNLLLELPASQYILTISSTAGGSVATPGEGNFAYDKGTAVDIVAEPDERCHFVEWTGDVDTIANVNAAHTTVTMKGFYDIIANFELEAGLCSLTISSTAGGSVAAPGKGTFIYNEGTAVALVAEAEAGYRFIGWTGNVGTIADANAAATTITLGGDYSITAKFVSVQAGNVGVRAGDWIKFEYTISGWPAGQAYPEWLRLEFLSVEGTNATTRATMHMSDGTEQSDTVPVDIVTGGGEALGFSGGIISANLTTGDSVYMTGYGDVGIEGETTRTYAGAPRTVVYASISQSVPAQGEIRLTYYWDKLTGVMVESSTTSGGIKGTAKATETNMWRGTTDWIPWWPWIMIVAPWVVGVGLAIIFVRRKRSTRVKKALN